MKKRNIAIIAVAGFIGIGAVGSAMGSAEEAGSSAKSNTASSAAPKSTEQPKSKAKPAAPVVQEETGPKLTSSQKNAVRAAENYLDMMPFSKKGLIRQLSSSAGDGYSVADATVAVAQLDADWKAEAVEAARNYLDMMPFSRSSLIQQLSSSAGDQYTKAEATYAANQVGL